MIFTDRFVYVHEPKTGGTFVTSMLFRLYGLEWSRLTHLRNMVFGEVRARCKYGTLVHDRNKHGGCREIPARERGKVVLATVRNPYDLWVSQYEFGWWRRKEFLKYFRGVPGFARDYPHFPDITFAEYVALADAAFRPPAQDGGGPGGETVGLRTREFVNFYFRDPAEALRRIVRDPGYPASPECRADMFDLRFVRTDQLNRGLHDFLSGAGYEREDIDFILGHGRVLPRGRGRGGGQEWQRYYTPELKRAVRERERALFELFPEFDL